MKPVGSSRETWIFLGIIELRFSGCDPLTIELSELILFGHAEATPES
jgi:hypothetical protein